MSHLSRMLVPTRSVESWRELLADPDKHWKPGRSAFELATAWEAANATTRGLPPDVAEVLDGHPDLAGASLLLGIPEHQVPFDGGGHASQSDMWALLKAPVGVVSVAVEAKAGEGFGQTVEEWLAGASPNSGKPARLAQLKTLLGLPVECPHSLRYQLFHRLASAVVEAKRFGAPAAMLLVQSFSSDSESHRAYRAFCEILGAEFGTSHVAKARAVKEMQVYVGWVGGH